MSLRLVALRYRDIDSSKGKIEVVAPSSAPMFVIVPFPVQEIERAPAPKYSTIAPVPPLTVRMPATFKITSLGAVQPFKEPFKWIPISLGQRTPHGSPTITSTASAPPTPTATMPSPPALGVCESVPIIIPPGNA